MKGYVYKICDNTNNNVYYGSTINTLKHRLNQHKNSNTCCSKSIIENNDYIIILVETIEFENKNQLLIREKYYIQNYPCINKNSPLQTEEERKENRRKCDKEYYELNKDKKKERNKEHYEANKDKISEKAKEYYEANKDKIKEQSKEYYELNKERIKEYDKERYDLNKEQILERNKEWRENNKDKRKDYQKEYYELNKEKKNEKMTCECGSIVCKGALSLHKKTKKHLNYINSINEVN